MKFNRYAVLGSNSFAGNSFITRALADGADVIGFNRSAEKSSLFLPYKKISSTGNYQFNQLDINNHLDIIIDRLQEFRPDVVVDFAGQGMVAESWQNPEQWYMTNFLTKVKMLESLRYSNWLHRYIKISTPEVYGSNNGLVKENFQYAPTTPYAISHSAIDMNLVALHKQYAFPVIFTRFANFYGPHQQLYRLIPRTIIYALTGKILQLQGGGAATRGFIYGEDVADGIMRTINQGILGEIYHFSPERFFTIRQVVEIICNKLNIRFNDFTNFVPDRPGKDQAYLMDSTKARMKLDWTESVSFESGIDSTIEWIKSSIDEIQSTPLEYVHKK